MNPRDKDHPITSTLHLVSPEAREIASSFPKFVPDLDAPHGFRDIVASLNPLEKVAHTEHLIPSATGTPDVRAVVYRPESLRGPRPAILYIHGGGFVSGSRTDLVPISASRC